MKKFTSIVLLLVFGLGMMAQNKVVTDQPNTYQKNSYKVVPNAKLPFMRKPGAATDRSGIATPIITNATWTDSAYFWNYVLGETYGRFYAFRLGRDLAIDSFNDFSYKWVAAQFDTMVDIETGNGYSAKITPVTIDSLYLYYSYTRGDSLPGSALDTLIINVYAGDIKLSPDVDTGSISNTILHSDTILLDSTFVVPANELSTLIDYPGDSVIPTGSFSIGFDFRDYQGDTTNHFYVVAGYGEACNDSCAALPTILPGNMQYDEISYFETFNKYQQYATPIETVEYNCSPTCNLDFGQDLNMYAFLTVTPPLVVTVSTDSVNVCPGGGYTLTGVISGGVPPYTYTWTGTNSSVGIENSFDSITGVTAQIGSNLTATITDTFKVYDSGNDSVISTIQINVKGIGVSITTPATDTTTIACGSTVDLTATLSGTTGNGTNTVWSGPQSPYFKGTIWPVKSPGTYTVTATNGFGCSATADVTVLLSDNQVPGFTIHTLSPYAPHNDTTTLSPCADAIDSFINTSANTAGWTWKWTYGDGQQGLNTNLVIQPGVFAPNSADTVTLVGDSGTCSVTYSEVITAIDCISGISTPDLANMVSVYPNPTNGLFNINFKGIDSKNVSVGVYDLLGQMVLSQDKFAVSGDQTQTLDLSKNSSGIYFVRIQVDGQPYTVRISLVR